MKKRGYVLILVLLLGLCLQAYAGGGQEGGMEKVTFSFWSGVTDTEAFFQEMIEEFQNENPNVEIEFQVLPIANLHLNRNVLGYLFLLPDHPPTL